MRDLVRVTDRLRRTLGPDAALWVGKMHQAGRSEEVISPEGLLDLVHTGADGVLLPLPGTVPGVTRELAADICRAVHAARGDRHGDQRHEPGRRARPRIPPALALLAKEVGVDAHHLGDAGPGHVADPDLVYEYSIAIRGRRHTWRRMVLGGRVS